MENIEIFEQELQNQNGSIAGKIAILKGGFDAVNPKAVMDKVVKDYVGNTAYCQFLEIHLDNPWVRVVIKGINDIQYKPLEKNSKL